MALLQIYRAGCSGIGCEPVIAWHALMTGQLVNGMRQLGLLRWNAPPLAPSSQKYAQDCYSRTIED